MKTTLSSYMADVKSQLHCNASKEDKEKYVTYTWSNDDIDENLDYFKSCKRSGMSAHTALELFYDHMVSQSF